MKQKHACLFTALFIVPMISFSQAPDLGTAYNFAFFTSVGAFTNTGASTITGDIGTNVGALTGFPPGSLTGQTHVADGVTAQAAIDLDAAYIDLDSRTCGAVLGTTLGNNQILTPNTYCLGAASLLNGDLILDGSGDSNALFIFQVDGALSTNPYSKIILRNGASFHHIYWQVNGAVSLGNASTFMGSILANGAITLLEGASIFGKGLTKAGAISLHNNQAVRFNSILNIKLYIEGYYTGGGLMSPVLLNEGVIATSTVTDSITVELRKTTAPYTLLSTAKTILNTNGTATTSFPVIDNAYIIIKHRNGLQTWSTNPVSISHADSYYDFSSAANQAYGNNMVEVEPNIWALYSGDINQDENIDLIDGSVLESDINNFQFGYYTTDINGDGNVDLLDYSILEKNVIQFISSNHP